MHFSSHKYLHILRAELMMIIICRIRVVLGTRKLQKNHKVSYSLIFLIYAEDCLL